MDNSSRIVPNTEVWIIEGDLVRRCKLIFVENNGRVSLKGDCDGDIRPVDTFYKEEKAAYVELKKRVQNKVTENLIKIKNIERLMEKF